MGLTSVQNIGGGDIFLFALGLFCSMCLGLVKWFSPIVAMQS